MTSVAVVTPTIGLDYLEKCCESVINQTYSNIIHHIFVDGKENYEKVEKIVRKFNTDKYRLNAIEENIGKGWYGHRIYAACSFLVNQEAIIYLDEDNWLEPNHVESLVNRLGTNVPWAYSLRKIYDREQNYICDDNCESLGKWPVFFDENSFLIDTSCFLINRSIAVSIGHSWYAQWGADRQFLSVLKKHFPGGACTNEHTLCYRLGGNETSVRKEFFEKGNSVQLEKYGSKENFPWLKRSMQIGPGISIQM